MKKQVKKEPREQKTWYLVDGEKDPLINTEDRFGIGNDIKFALEDFKEDNGKRPKYYAYKLTLLGEIQENITIKDGKKIGKTEEN